MLGFIINPTSGNGYGIKAWQQIERILIARSRPYKAAFTQAARDAYSITGDFLGDGRMNAIIAVGGDGTLHEVANGIHHASSHIPLGCIPAGSGNDFARGYGIPMQIEDALVAILDPHDLLDADVLKMGERIAMNAIGAGFDARIARVTDTSGYKGWLNKLGLGKLAYVVSLIRVLVTYKPCQATVTVDGQTYTYKQVWLITTANIPHIGGGMAICPMATPTDGLADICVVSGITKLKLLLLFPRVYKGAHINLKEVRFHRGRQIRITADQPLDIHMDGESAGECPAAFEVHPGKVRVIIPKIKSGGATQ